MPALYLTEADVAWLLDVRTAIDVVQTALEAVHNGRAENQPRRRAAAPGLLLHTMAATAEYLGYAGIKAYTTTRSSAQFQVLLYDLESGRPAAVIDANLLGQMRTGGASGVATRAMARPDAAVVGCFGTGFQARAQLQAVCAVRKIERIQVYGRHEDRRRTFAKEMTELCDVPVEALSIPEDVAAEKDIVITATSSKVPLFDGRALDEGTHLNVIGSNFLTKAEVDVTTLRRADHIVCDSRAACELEAGDFVPALEAGVLEWSRVRELGEVLAGDETGRATPDDITLFKSVGLAIEDVAVAVHVLQRAREEKLGQPLPW
jgi:ornithine cyclodeaminase/alanine dehydrogenase-like protein (mu-crystallin family)